jgi:hypothetical protein
MSSSERAIDQERSRKQREKNLPRSRFQREWRMTERGTAAAVQKENEPPASAEAGRGKTARQERSTEGMTALFSSWEAGTERIIEDASPLR